MSEHFTANDWPSIVAIVVANALVIWQNNSALGKQTRRLRAMFVQAKKETHRELEGLRLRLSAVEQKVDGLIGRRQTDMKAVVLQGGDPEVGHVPPKPGGPDRPLP